MVVLASQLLVSSGLGLAAADTRTSALRGVGTVDVFVTGVALVLVVLGARGVSVPDPLLLGLGLGVALTAMQVVEFQVVAPAAEQPTPIPATAMLLTIVGGHAWIATMMSRDLALPGWARIRLVVTVCLIGFAHVAGAGLVDTRATDLATAIALAGAASLWTSATFVLLRETLSDQRQRSLGLEGSLLEIESSWRGSREQLHEIRSTVAGAACACRLLNDHDISATTHDKLEMAIGTELDRLERLVFQQSPGPPGPVDIDATLEVLLSAHRARGRTITWEPSGATVHARPDDVTGAINVLLDNAATHGGSTSRVVVTHAEDLVEIAVSDEGPGVPSERRDQIFDWGVRGSESPGQGIGLSLARRLISEHGGSLSLAEPSAQGASFVIRLPAARRSEENHVFDS